MKFLEFTLFCALIAVTFAFAEEGLYADSAHPGKCVYADLILSPGESGKPKGRCERFWCHEANGWSSRVGCGVEIVDPPCELGDYIDVDAPYEECCKRHHICP